MNIQGIGAQAGYAVYMNRAFIRAANNRIQDEQQASDAPDSGVDANRVLQVSQFDRVQVGGSADSSAAAYAALGIGTRVDIAA